MTIIGDVHGKLDQYKEITDNCAFSICVGDFGFQKEWDWHHENIGGCHEINMGNHDYLPYLYSHPASLRNYNYFPSFGVFSVRGAFSIDKIHRTEGLDWFPNEELTYQEGLHCFDEYCKIKPKIVISHDCPQSVCYSLFGIYQKSDTRNLLQAMFEEHEPELWVFGHHHESKDIAFGKTRFICLNELETFEI